VTRVAHRGTTLIELLVVVSIIGSLMGILMPTLSSGRETGRSVVCASNLRQLQAANSDYALDHRDRYMPAAKQMQFKNLHRWHGTRTNQNESFDPSTGELVDYLNNSSISTQIRECPTFAQTLDALAESGDGFERGNGGYGYNAAFVGVERRGTPQGMWEIRTDMTGSRTNRFASPTRTIAFADSAFTGRDSLIEYSFVEPRFWPQWGQWRTDASIHFRHAGGANVVWLDGHVDSQQRSHSEPGWASRADAGTLGLGWFGHSDDNSLYDYD
jgi:prepilin-type processing-associated H-X9-DG protein/prepilin-type N-terminal cleavage/methylation domain-containing protein